MEIQYILTSDLCMLDCQVLTIDCQLQGPSPPFLCFFEPDLDQRQLPIEDFFMCSRTHGHPRRECNIWNQGRTMCQLDGGENVTMKVTYWFPSPSLCCESLSFYQPIPCWVGGKVMSEKFRAQACNEKELTLEFSASNLLACKLIWMRKIRKLNHR